MPGRSQVPPPIPGDKFELTSFFNRSVRGARAEQRSVPRVQPPIGDHGQSGAQFLVANRRVPEGLRLQLNLRG